jgi:hypothetical protein
MAMVLALFSSGAHADEWESEVNGIGAYNAVQTLLKYKKGQADEVEAIFYGLRDTLYVASPSRNTTYSNNSLTPNSVDYTVTVTAKYNRAPLETVKAALKTAKYFRKGQTSIRIKFPSETLTIKLFDEVLPIYKRLVRGGYSFEARAVLLDNEQTVLATSDNSLLLSTRMSGLGLDFSGKPQLRTYQKAEPPDISNLSSGTGKEKDEARESLMKFLAEPSYRLSSSNQASFYSLPTENLKTVTSCRVLRESDELLVYKRDQK